MRFKWVNPLREIALVKCEVYENNYGYKFTGLKCLVNVQTPFIYFIPSQQRSHMFSGVYMFDIITGTVLKNEATSDF